jgi:hypothetical protein
MVSLALATIDFWLLFGAADWRERENEVQFS